MLITGFTRVTSRMFAYVQRQLIQLTDLVDDDIVLFSALIRRSCCLTDDRS